MIGRWLASRLRGTAPEAPLPRPDPPVVVIGDLHGRADLLERMLDRIAAEPGGATARRIFVGDLVDRGPDSADVLARLRALCAETPERTVCLMGNHERMLLDFLDDPDRAGPRWIAVGGAETLTSFGIDPWSGAGMSALADALRTATGATTRDWLAALPLSWSEGTLAVTHAGADPARDLAGQSARRLLWGPRGREGARRDGLWVAQGHVVVPQPVAEGGRIMLDTGAWHSGRLSAGWLDASGLRFLDVQASCA